MNRLTFGSEKDKLRTVVDNGVDVSDERIMMRTNEATQLILGLQHPTTGEPVIPVNCMMIAEVDVVDGHFYLPPEMDSAIHMETAVPETDLRQGFYNIINPFTYIDPSMSHDQPFYDLFLAQHTTPGIFQRHYYYPDFANGRIRVVGPKAYIPITSDSDALIVQNVPAIKKMIQSIEYAENNRAAEEKEYYDRSREIIIGEIKKHNMDPRWILKRKGSYEADLSTYTQGSMGWTRARIALEVPGAMDVGREDIMRVIDRAQLRMIGMGGYKGTLEEFNARITDGFIYLPSRVESVLAASFDGWPIDIRSIFYKYIKTGPGGGCCGCGCWGGRLEDAGETFFPGNKTRRRTYRAHVGPSNGGGEVTMVCKLRWEPKKPEEQLTIRNFEANRIMAGEILAEQMGNWGGAQAAEATVKMILDKELREYLAGVKQVFPSMGIGQMRSLGGVL